MKQIATSVGICFLLLVIQGILSAARTILTCSRWERAPGHATVRHDITGLSVALDLALWLVLGSYFAIGVMAWDPVIQMLKQSQLERAMSWITPVTYILLLVLISWLNLSLGVLLPEALGSTFAEQWRGQFFTLIHGIYSSLKPLVQSALRLGNTVARWFGGNPVQRTTTITEEQIKSLVEVGEKAGTIQEEERKMIHSVFQLGETIAREVMIPRTDIAALDAETPPETVMDTILTSGHSRIPVYQGTIDNIIGILYAKDLLTVPAAEALPTKLRPAYFVPESKRLDTLLREMKVKKIQLAIVVDEYGGVAGLVTLEDIVEEIVGEIQDEYDHEEPGIRQLEDGGYLFDARLPLDDIAEVLTISLPLEEADSLGGFVYDQLGHIPDIGEQLIFNDVMFEVVETAGRRILKVRATKDQATHG